MLTKDSRKSMIRTAHSDYEKEKERIIEKPMDSADYEKAIREIAKKLKI